MSPGRLNVIWAISFHVRLHSTGFLVFTIEWSVGAVVVLQVGLDSGIFHDRHQATGSVGSFGLTQTHPGSSRIPHANTYHQSSNADLTYAGSPASSFSIISSPTVETMDNSLESTSRLSIIRRASSGAYTLQESESRNGATQTDAEQDGFYLLKKDSQRRMTLGRVLLQDEVKICQDWMSSIAREIGETSLTQSHLGLFLRGLKEYIADENKQALESRIRAVKEKLGLDGDAQPPLATSNHLQLAISLVQEPINKALKLHNIKPHWMFALDNFVRDAVQTAVTVLSPELGANLAGEELDQCRLNVSSANISRKNSVDSFGETTPSVKAHLDEMAQLKSENMKLLSEIIDGQHTIHRLLRQVLEEQKKQLEFVNSTLDQYQSVGESRLRRDTGYSSRSNVTSHSPSSLVPQISVMESPGDAKMVQWLSNLGVEQQVIERIALEEYTLDDMLNYVSRADLRRLNLKGGTELKIWKAVVEHRCSRGRGGASDGEEWQQSLEYMDAVDCFRQDVDSQA